MLICIYGQRGITWKNMTAGIYKSNAFFPFTQCCKVIDRLFQHAHWTVRSCRACYSVPFCLLIVLGFSKIGERFAISVGFFS